MLKRMFDFVIASAALVIVSPLLLIIAVLIKLDSSGPIFYRARRTGQYGKPMIMLKFRTMIVDAEKLGTTSLENDPRITRAGKWLRRYKLDELPQFINVFRGDMSLVGPRPEVEEHTAEYTPEEMAILKVKPGITDLASIRFRNLNAIVSHAPDPHAYFVKEIRPIKNRLRLEYAEKQSFWLDLKIIFWTLKAVLVR